MKNIFLRAMLVCIVLPLSACAGLSKKECTTANWQTKGLSDGKIGAPANTIDTHAKACASYSVMPDSKAYEAGRSEGLKTYCTLQGGVAAGRSGRRYESVCPADTEKVFLTGLKRGYFLHAIWEDLDEVRRLRDHDYYGDCNTRHPSYDCSMRMGWMRADRLFAAESQLRQYLFQAEEAVARGEDPPFLYQPGYWRYGFPFGF